MKPWCIQTTSATTDITVQVNILHLLRTIPSNEKGSMWKLSWPRALIVLYTNSYRIIVVIKTPYFKHEYATFMSTFCVINNSESSNIFWDMDSLSLILEWPVLWKRSIICLILLRYWRNYFNIKKYIIWSESRAGSLVFIKTKVV